MKKSIIPILLSMAALSSLSGCSSQPAGSTGTDTVETITEVTIPAVEATTSAAPAVETAAATEATTASPRVITDLGGNEVELPPVSEINHVVIISPPVTSVLLDVIPDKDMITGLSPKAFAFSNPDLMAKLYPNAGQVDTTFIDDSFTVNTESLLNLNPDLILYYGEIQKKGVINIGIPAIDLFPKGLTDPKDVTIAWDNLLREVFAADPAAGTAKGLETEWARAEELAKHLLSGQTGDPQRALCIFSNVGGSLMVSGSSSFDSYAQSFFDKAGLINVAAEIQGTSEVSMEQIYEWNPDIIFIFHNAPAQAFLDNSITGQDWSLLDAWQNKQIYDIPQTAYSWGAPCADSPLMPLWLISKAYPELFSEDDFAAEMTDYYSRRHHITITPEDIASVLGMRGMNTP